jgi:predicted amidohydrolase
MTVVRASVVQAAPVPFDRERTLEKLRALAADAARDRAQLSYAAVQGNDPKTVISRGASCIVSPLGKFLAGPSFGAEAILTADLDLAEIVRGKFDFDVTGHYARPDVFRLTVNEAPAPAVTFVGSAPREPDPLPGPERPGRGGDGP